MSDKINHKRVVVFTGGLLAVGALTLAFSQTLEPIECEPQNTQWVTGPLGALAKTCER